MSERVGHYKGLICVTAANVCNSQLYLTGHTDFFPTDAIGSEYLLVGENASRKANRNHFSF